VVDSVFNQKLTSCVDATFWFMPCAVYERCRRVASARNAIAIGGNLLHGNYKPLTSLFVLLLLSPLIPIFAKTSI
jgi:hypothetical protein